MNMDIIFYVGFFLVCTGGASLDSNGTGYIIALTLCAAGILCMAVYLAYLYWNARQIEKAKQKRVIQRMLERERRRAS